MNARRSRLRVSTIAPKPTPVALEGDALAVWNALTDFHTALCQRAGEVNRDQWLQLLFTASNAVRAWAIYSQRGVQ